MLYARFCDGLKVAIVLVTVPVLAVTVPVIPPLRKKVEVPMVVVFMISLNAAVMGVFIATLAAS